MSDHSRTWWANGSTTTARKTAVAALVVTLVLTGVSALVWASPQGSISRHVLAAVIDTFDSEPQQQEEQENAQLLADYAALQEAYDEESASSAQLEEHLSELEAALAAANDALASSRVENSRLSSALADGSTGTGAETSSSGPSDSGASSSGSGSSGSSGETSGSSGSTPAPEQPTAPTPSEPSQPSEPEITAPPLADLAAPADPLYGMYTQQAPFNWATYDDTSSRVGARPNVVGYFGGWDEDFRPHAVERAWTRDTMPILTWESRPISSPNNVVDEPDYSLPRILAGEFDDYLHTYARDIVDLGLPLGIRLNHEMNGTWYPWSETTSSGAPINGNNPGDYVRVWQYVHDIFEAEGANDHVVWIWSPNIVNNLPTAHRTPEHLASLYPGDDYVDWVGLSGYLRPPYREGQTFTFDYTFGQSLAQLRDLTDKPIFLAEVGASETGGHKPAWITSFFDALGASENDDVIGFAWFNLAITTYVEGQRATNDWRIDSRADTLQAFREGLLDPELGYRLQPY